MMRYVPAPAGSRARRRRLQQPAGKMPRLGQQEQADLLDVRAGRDVDQVVFVIGAKRLDPLQSRGACA